ncbi:MAG TPA: DUF4142 domain-containing protein [Solirubrobacterales bacterium]|nr:DUF4142 domain-containing protein [Solirubrobacterales bacterium]
MFKRIGFLVLPAAVLLAVGGAGALSTSAAPKVSAFDEQALKGAIQGDRFEIDGGAVATKQSQNQKVKDLAARLVKDHTKSLTAATKLAKKLGISVPKSPTFTQNWEIDQIRTLTGTAFDKAYTSLEIADHKQDIAEMNETAKKATDSRLRSNAKKELPTLKTHLKLAQQTASGL